MKYITLGWDCSPATALRNLQLREYALPFDWIRSNAEILSKVIENNFSGFHESLKLSENKQFVIDTYGLNFPHDYPTIKQNCISLTDKLDETILISEWEKYVPVIQEKYKRRIERFHSIMNSEEPLIALYSGFISDIQLFKDVFKRRYNKTNIFYVVLSEECVTDDEKEHLLENHKISLCEPEEVLVDENDNMFIEPLAQAKLWKAAIDKIYLKI